MKTTYLIPWIYFPIPGGVKQLLPGLLALLIAMMLAGSAKGQTDKKILLADKYFAAGEYLTAASLYGQFLNPVTTSKAATDFPLNSNRSAEGKTGANRTKMDIRMKQADSYRLSFYMNEAAALYKQCFDKEPAKYADALYWYAVCQRSVGNYETAAESINRFLDEYASQSGYRSAAEKEKQVIEFAKKEMTRPDTVLYTVLKINSSFGVNNKGFFAAVPVKENKYIVTSTVKETSAEGINPYHNRLFHASFKTNGIDHIEPIGIEAGNASINQGAATISTDGNHIYFTQWKKEQGKELASIYYTTKTENGWSKPIAVTALNKAGSNNKQPFITADGKQIFFASDRAGGAGGFDIWYAPIMDNGQTGEPVHAGNDINTADDELAPFYHHATGTLVFASGRLPSMGGLDLFASKGSVNSWKSPENLGHPVNSSRDDIYFYSTGSSLLSNAILSSDRGNECCMAAYTVVKTEKKKQITGIIRDCKDNAPLADAVVTLKDAEGNILSQTTGADGIYKFELGALIPDQVTVSREKYNESTTAVQLERTDESNWQTQTLVNSPLCIEKKLVIKVENVVTVYFDFDKYELKEAALEKLDSIYSVLSMDTTYTIQISGYTDGLGTEEYNKILSDKRARACADYLITMGLDANRISFESFGACCPIEMELINGRDNPDGRSMNRRALININKE